MTGVGKNSLEAKARLHQHFAAVGEEAVDESCRVIVRTVLTLAGYIEPSREPMTRLAWVENLDRKREAGTATLEDHFGAGSPYGEGADYLVSDLGG